MFVVSNFLLAFAKIIEVLLTMAYWLVLIRALISWVNPDPFNPIVMFLRRTTDPILDPVRRLLPQNLPIDISPIIVFLVIIFLKEFLVGSITDMAFRLR
jgi:YggT family protein